MSTSRRVVTPCSWGVRAGMVRVWVAGKTVWSSRYTRAISEHFRNKELTYKVLYKFSCLLLLTTVNLKISLDTQNKHWHINVITSIYLMSSSSNDLLQARALRSNVSSLRNLMSSTDNASMHCNVTVPHTYQCLTICCTIIIMIIIIIIIVTFVYTP